MSVPVLADSPRSGVKLDRSRVRWARDKSLLIYRLMAREGERAQVDRMHRAQFGEWSDGFARLEACRGRAMLCVLGKTVLGYQSFDPEPMGGNPFGADQRSMRFTFIQVREDEEVQARGLGLARELLARTLELSWSWDYDVVYTYATAYELLADAGFVPMAGEGVVKEAIYVREMDPEQAPPLLMYIRRPR